MEASRWLKNKIIKTSYGGNWNALGALISIFLSIATSIVLAARLPQEIFGLYKYAYTIVGFFSAFTLSGIQTTLLHNAARGNGNMLIAARALYIRNAVPYMICIALYASYALYSGNGIAFAGTIFIGGIGLIATNAAGMYMSILAGKELYRTGVKISAIIATCQAIATICAALITNNIATITTVSLFFTLLPTIYFYHTHKTHYGAEPSVNTIADMEKESRLLTGTHIAAALSNYGDKIIVFNMLGAANLASYAIADDIVVFGRGIIKSYVSTHIPRIAREKMKSTSFLITLMQSMAYGALLCGAYWIIAPHALGYFYGAYANAGRYAAMLSVILIFIAPLTYMAYIFQAWKMIRAIYISTITTHLFRIPGYALGAFYFGVEGIIVAHIITYAGSMALSIILIKKSGYVTQ